MAQTALCIGINDYPGTGSDLSGCVNDAQEWAQVLTDRGLSVTTLLDAQADLAAITEGMAEVVAAADYGELAVITFSGHGTWLPDEDGDEPDLRDEALCPHDFMTKGALLDDTLHEVFAGRQRGARVVFISDSCHSGSVARMSPALGGRHDAVKFLPPGLVLSDEDARHARLAERAPARGRSRGSVVLMSGCRDTEFSYDAHFGERPNGAFTRVALDALVELDDDATYAQWHRAIRRALPSRDYPQTPVLTATSSQRRWPVLRGR